MAKTVIAGMVIATGMVVAVPASASPVNALPVNAASPTNQPTAIGSAPPVPAGARTVGALPATYSISATVTLNPPDPDALEAYATAVSTPGNALYRQHLSTAAFATRFGPSASAVAAVQAALEADGLNPGDVSDNHLAIRISASAAAFSTAFGTSFTQYRLPGGRVAYANTSAPEVPSSIAGTVQGVIGLDDLVLAHPQGMSRAGGSARGATRTATPHVVTGGPAPCATAVTAGPDNSAYTADQIATAYGFPSLYGAGDFGTGQTIAMYELESNLPSDIAAYQSCYRTSAPISYVQVDDGATGQPSGSGEAVLDIENAIGIAPKAAQLVYQGPNTDSGAYDTYNAIISQNRATIISTSWGVCELQTDAASVAGENTLFQEAAVQGQSLFDASGDDGSEDCGDSRLSADDPGGQPFVTVVGGTTLTDPTANTRTEVMWNRRATGEGAGGAGISRFFRMPTYQSGAAASLHVVNANSSATICKAAAGSYCRQEPDVALVADPETGFLIYFQGSWTGTGGTSGAAPIWAAFAALVNSSAGCAGRTVGFVNPALYGIAGTAYAANFTDIVSGNSDYTGDHGGLYPTAVGYDIASGLGTPKGAALAASLCGGASPAPVLVTGAYQALAPTRILDTRTGLGTVKAKIPAMASITLAVAGRGGIPASTAPGGRAPSAVSVNFTAINAGAPGYLTVYPAGRTRPIASDLNFTVGHDVANTTVATLGTGGSVTIFNGSKAPVDVAGDVAGYYLAGPTPSAATIPGAYQPLPNQTRLLDTRTPGGGGPLGAGSIHLLTVTGGTAGVPADAASVVLNVTSVDATGNGHFRVYPAGTALPPTSNLNFTTHRTVADEVVVSPGTQGRIAIFNGGATATSDVVVDLVGYIVGGSVPSSKAGLQQALASRRMLDTRSRIGTSIAGKVPAGGTRVVKIVGVAPVPSTARAAVITVTATGETKPGYASVYPGKIPPAASIVNFLVNTDVANLTIAPLAADGTITIYNGSAGPTDLVIDISAYVTGTPAGG